MKRYLILIVIVLSTIFYLVNNTDKIKIDFEEVDELPNTLRGSGGFGSTGKWKKV